MTPAERTAKSREALAQRNGWLSPPISFEADEVAKIESLKKSRDLDFSSLVRQLLREATG